MKKEEADIDFERFRNMDSLNLRTRQIAGENNLIEQAFSSRELFWENQKSRLDNLMASLNVDILDVKQGFSTNVLVTEKLITDFRNRVKTEKLDLLKRNIESWTLNEFVTKKRFSELLAIEMKASQKRI